MDLLALASGSESETTISFLVNGTICYACDSLSELLVWVRSSFSSGLRPFTLLNFWTIMEQEKKGVITAAQRTADSEQRTNIPSNIP